MTLDYFEVMNSFHMVTGILPYHLGDGSSGRTYVQTMLQMLDPAKKQ